MDVLLHRFRNLSILIIVLLAQLVLLAYQVKGDGDARLIRVWAVTAVMPIAQALEWIRSHTIGVAEEYFVLVNVREENLRLKQELTRLKLENQFLAAELQTAERAEALRAFQARTPSRTLAARIIGTGTGTNARVVFVDRGAANGVLRGMPVITPDGIVGKVVAVYPTASQVQLITDPTFAAGVLSAKNRVHGTLKGLGQSKCLVDYVQNEEKVEQGEMFYTSGEDRIFPRGMPVGVASVVRPGKTFKEIYVVPSGFQRGLEEVLIVLQGVHQSIPDPNTPSLKTEVYVQPPPPADEGEAVRDPLGALSTDADRLKKRYQRIGEAQGHKFGEGLPGSKPPDFNIDPDRVAPAGKAAVGGTAAGAGAPAAAPATAPLARPGTGAGPAGAAGAAGTAVVPKSRPSPPAADDPPDR
jgi:rod shape-determining protein MreC